MKSTASSRSLSLNFWASRNNTSASGVGSVSTAATKCANWRRKSVPVGLREKGRKALVFGVAARSHGCGSNKPTRFPKSCSGWRRSWPPPNRARRIMTAGCWRGLRTRGRSSAGGGIRICPRRSIWPSPGRSSPRNCSRGSSRFRRGRGRTSSPNWGCASSPDGGAIAPGAFCEPGTGQKEAVGCDANGPSLGRKRPRTARGGRRPRKAWKQTPGIAIVKL